MNEVVINYGYDVSKIIRVNDVDYVPKDLLDEVIHDRRQLAVDYIKLTKDFADLKKTMRNAKNNINENNMVRLKPEKPEPLEERIYPGWAMTLRKEEKREINRKIYERLCRENKITRIAANIVDPSYDLVLETTTTMYATEYIVSRNRNNLTAEEIALCVDYGNLCFGFTGDEHKGSVWTD